MNLEELFSEVGRAEAAGDVDRAEALLARTLRETTDVRAHAHLHEALANHFGRRCLFRKMNEHEDASARSFGALPDGTAIAEAHARYRDAIDAFGARDDARGLALLRPAVGTLRTRLGELHPYARQVTNTLAGRSRDVAERLPLRAALLASARVVYGDDHVNTLRALVGLGHALGAVDRTTEATSSFERAFDALTGARSVIEGAMGLRIAGELASEAYQALVKLHGATRSFERLAAREEILAKFHPRAAWNILQSRLARSPRVRWAYNARSIQHASVHFPGLAEDVRITLDVTAATASAVRARLVLVKARAKPESPEWHLVSGLEELVLLRIAEAPDTVDRPAFFALRAIEELEDLEDGPLQTAEHAWQSQLFDELWRTS